MSDQQTCAQCGGELVVGRLGTVRDTELFWAESQSWAFDGMRMVRSSGPGLRVTALRCASCGRLELSANA